MERLRVVVFTQQDRFFIPENIIKAAQVCEILEVVDNQSKNSFENKMGDIVKWFGFIQCAKMGFVTIGRIIEGAVDSISGLRFRGGRCSIISAAKIIGAAYIVVSNVNSTDYIAHIKDLNPDLIISYSAPQVVKPELLRIPRFGVINVHGALLPNYRGLLPSFWYLYNNEKLGGATVHRMSATIDDGDILVQDSVDISGCRSMFELMKKTKQLGGELMVEAIKQFANGTVYSKVNDTENGSYFTWPTVEQAREFRKNGKRLI